MHLQPGLNRHASKNAGISHKFDSTITCVAQGTHFQPFFSIHYREINGEPFYAGAVSSDSPSKVNFPLTIPYHPNRDPDQA